MWSVVFESNRVEDEVKKLIKTGHLTKEDQIIIRSWIQQVIYHGPDSIRGDFKWADHPLTGDWKGYRASAFSSRGRILYKIESEKITIRIARITSDHNYKKGLKK